MEKIHMTIYVFVDVLLHYSKKMLNFVDVLLIIIQQKEEEEI